MILKPSSSGLVPPHNGTCFIWVRIFRLVLYSLHSCNDAWSSLREEILFGWQMGWFWFLVTPFILGTFHALPLWGCSNHLFIFSIHPWKHFSLVTHLPTRMTQRRLLNSRHVDTVIGQFWLTRPHTMNIKKWYTCKKAAPRLIVMTVAN